MFVIPIILGDLYMVIYNRLDLCDDGMSKPWGRVHWFESSATNSNRVTKLASATIASDVQSCLPAKNSFLSIDDFFSFSSSTAHSINVTLERVMCCLYSLSCPALGGGRKFKILILCDNISVSPSNGES
jgi:hypothetical protein